jgi:hypothetical protein
MRRRVKLGKTFDLSVEVEDAPVIPAPKKSRRIAVGQEFDADVAIAANWGDALDAITRSRLTWAVFAVTVCALGGATAIGFAHGGEFSALQSVWGVTAPVYGGIAGYFFSRKEGGGKTSRQR